MSARSPDWDKITAVLKNAYHSGSENLRLLLLGSAWLASVYFAFYPQGFPDSVGLAAGLHFIFVYLFAKEIADRSRGRAELLLGGALLFYVLDYFLLRHVYAGSGAPAPFMAHPHLLLQACFMLWVSALVILASKGRKGALLWFFILGWLGVQFAESGGLLPRVLLQVALFVFLLRKTAWLEKLAKSECWIYLFAGILVFRAVWIWDPLALAGAPRFQQSHLWYGGPWFMVVTLQLFLFAVLVKIPVVLVYNFASLARKLRISGLFQSTVPQVIQATMLLLIFYFFVAGWQAEKVRKALLDTMMLISEEQIPPPDYWVKLEPAGIDEIRLPGYEPFRLGHDFPGEGVLQLGRNAPPDSGNASDFLVFVRRYQEQSDAEVERLYFTQVDSSFLALVARNTSVLAGSRLLAYPYVPTSWESYLYSAADRIRVMSGRGRFRIFPFGLVSNRSAATVESPLGLRTNAGGISVVDKLLRTNRGISAGRVAVPVLNAGLQASGFFAFDVLLVPDSTLVTSTLLSYLALLVFIYFLVNFSVTRRIVKFGEEINHAIVHKFNQLRSGIHEIATGNLDYRVSVEGRDEFVELADRFNEMGDRLQASLAEAREKERLAHELAIARKVQLDLLPRALPEIAGFELAASLQTANEVGGDFYDVIPLSRNRFLFAVGDVSGKGTSAAFYMAQFISLLRYSPEFTEKPDEIAYHLNRYFSDPVVDRHVFVTAVIGVLNAKTGTLQFVRAGHTLPLYVPAAIDEAVREVRKNGMGIGLDPGGRLFQESLEIATVHLQPGDAFVFHTDGVEEATQAGAADNAAPAFYGTVRLASVVSRSRGKRARQMLKELEKDLEKFCRDTPRADDYTVVVLRRNLDGQ